MPGLLRKVAAGARIHRADEAASIGLVALIMLDEDSGTIRDLVSGTSTPLTSGSVGRGEAGRYLSFNGSQGTNMALRFPVTPSSTTARDHGRNFAVLGRLRPLAVAATSPGAVFGIYHAAGQGGFGVGWNDFPSVGLQWLTGNTASTAARTASAVGVWSTVYATIKEDLLGYAWIDGQPAQAAQGGSLDSGTGGAHTEISLGAQHRSSGFLRYAQGDLEWGAVLYGKPLNDAAAFNLYSKDFPYNLLTPRRRYWLVPGAGGVDATAPGATISATASIAAGAATADSTASGATISVSASLQAGAATAASTTPGATITATASLITGAVTADSTAPGVTVVITPSLIVGAAAADSAAAGSTITSTASLVPGSVSADSTAQGAVVTATASLVPGTASGTGDATAPGTTISVAASFVAGAATAASTAPGATVTTTGSLVAGSASAASTAPGGTVAILATLIPGAAFGGILVPGATLVASVSLIPGAVSADSIAAGRTFTITTSFIGGAASNGESPNNPPSRRITNIAASRSSAARTYPVLVGNPTRGRIPYRRG